MIDAWLAATDSDRSVTRKTEIPKRQSQRPRKFAGNRAGMPRRASRARRARSRRLILPSIKRDHPITGVLP